MSLTRKTPLTQSSQLTRKTPIASKRATPRKAAPKPARVKVSPLAADPSVILLSESTLRARLAVRSGKWCEARLSGCTGRAEHMCHRITDGMGGRPLNDDLRLSNVWAGCATCHQWTHHQPTEAKDMGLMLENWQDPATERIAYQDRGWFILCDDGDVLPFDETTAEPLGEAS